MYSLPNFDLEVVNLVHSKSVVYANEFVHSRVKDEWGTLELFHFGQREVALLDIFFLFLFERVKDQQVPLNGNHFVVLNCRA